MGQKFAGYVEENVIKSIQIFSVLFAILVSNFGIITDRMK
jgi:hypothetical protein